MSIPSRQRPRTGARAIARAYGPYPAVAGLFRGRFAGMLSRWAGVPPRLHNQYALVCTAAEFLGAVAPTWNMADRTMALRLVSLVLFSAHVAANKSIVAILTCLRDRGLAEAGRALDAYRGPGRLTSLDLGLMWIGFGVFAPVLNLLAPVGTGFPG